MGKVRKTDIQIRFADADVLGHINNTHLQEYFDLGKSDFSMHLIRTRPGLGKISLVMVSYSANFYAQTRLDDEVYVETSVSRIGNKSMTLFQRLIDGPTGRVNADCTSTLVAFDTDAQQSVPLPEKWKALWAEYLGAPERP